jgi:SAM-dependent methyltransferase
MVAFKLGNQMKLDNLIATTPRHYEPGDDMLGGFTATDGTIAFFTRINAILEPEFTVLDLGAGRASWYFLDQCEYRRKLRTIRGKVKEYICADIDEAVLSNPTSDRNVVIRGDGVPLEDESVDVILADFVLEHVLNVATFRGEVSRLLKPGGYFCARTPHRLHYVSMFARLIRNKKHSAVLRKVQPTRQAEDVFPTSYLMNTLGAARRSFPEWADFSYIHASEPRYFFGSRTVYRLFVLLHALLPKAFIGNVFIFLKKQ